MYSFCYLRLYSFRMCFLSSKSSLPESPTNIIRKLPPNPRSNRMRCSFPLVPSSGKMPRTHVRDIIIASTLASENKDIIYAPASVMRKNVRVRFRQICPVVVIFLRYFVSTLSVYMYREGRGMRKKTFKIHSKVSLHVGYIIYYA